MGCGDCDNFSHSLTVPMATNDVDVLQRISKQLFSHFHIGKTVWLTEIFIIMVNVLGTTKIHMNSLQMLKIYEELACRLQNLRVQTILSKVFLQ